MGYDFHRQKPLDNYIADFFCHELMLAIELDGYTHLLEEVQDKDEKKEKRLNIFLFDKTHPRPPLNPSHPLS